MEFNLSRIECWITPSDININETILHDLLPNLFIQEHGINRSSKLFSTCIINYAIPNMYAGSGFCDSEFFFESNDNRGDYNWSEVKVDALDEQECFYQPLEMTGKAKRKCQSHRNWISPYPDRIEYDDRYDGSECVTLATHQLRQLSNVSLEF